MEETRISKRIVFHIIPGFLGNVSEPGFVRDLASFLKKMGMDFFVTSFPGYGPEEEGGAIPTIEEMVAKVESDHLCIEAKTSDRERIVLAHSQGSAISLSAAGSFGEKTEIRMFAPAILLGEAIAGRISDGDRDRIRNGETLACRMSSRKTRLITPEWLESYERFSIEGELGTIGNPCRIIRPANDHIPEDNASLLIKSLKTADYREVEGDHTFFNPSGSFERMAREEFGNFE